MFNLYIQYESTLKNKAMKNPMSMNGDVFEEKNVDSLKYSLALPIKLKYPLKKSILHKNVDTQKTLKCDLRKIQKILKIKPPVTHNKIVRIMDRFDIPLEKFTAISIEVLIRKYFNSKLKEFGETTFKRYFFNNRPPFPVDNNINITWKDELKGLIKTFLDHDGLIIKKSSEKLDVIISYCSHIINTAYNDSLDRPIRGTNQDEAFVKKINKYNTFASFVNNISSNLQFNSSSLIFTYFHKAKFDYDYINSNLGDIKFSSTDIEKMCLNNFKLDINENVDIAITDPYNVITFAGFPYETIKPALKAEFVLFKLLYYLRDNFENESLSKFIRNNYQQKYSQIKTDPFAINNVLQLCPGLMTLMFYIINEKKDTIGIVFLQKLNTKFIELINTKGYVGKMECIERHKQISYLIQQVCERCIELFITDKKQIKHYITNYVNILFLRSGLINTCK